MISTELVSKYLLMDFGATGAKGGSALQTELDLICGRSTFTVRESTGLSAGPWGRNGKDEVDPFAYSFQDTLPGTGITYTASVAYYDVGKVGYAPDDVVAGEIKLSRKLNLGGGITVAPYVGVKDYVHVSGSSPDFVTRAGGNATIPLGKDWSVDFDLAWVHNFSAHALHEDLAQGSLNPKWQLTPATTWTPIGCSFTAEESACRSMISIKF
jgi:hypothetical protein